MDTQDRKVSEIFGLRVMYLRRLNKMTQKHLAKELGISQQHLSDMENGRRCLTLRYAVALATLFEVSLDHFHPDREMTIK